MARVPSSGSTTRAWAPQLVFTLFPSPENWHRTRNPGLLPREPSTGSDENAREVPRAHYCGLCRKIRRTPIVHDSHRGLASLDAATGFRARMPASARRSHSRKRLRSLRYGYSRSPRPSRSSWRSAPRPRTLAAGVRLPELPLASGTRSSARTSWLEARRASGTLWTRPGIRTCRGSRPTSASRRVRRFASRSIPTRRTTASTSTASATTAATERAQSPPSSLPPRSLRVNPPASPTLRRASWTAATGRSRRAGPFRRSDLGGLLWPSSCASRSPAGAATSSSSSATTTAPLTCSSRRSDTTWQAYNQYGGNSLYVGLARPGAPTRSATTGRSRAAARPRRTGSSTPSTR